MPAVSIDKVALEDVKRACRELKQEPRLPPSPPRMWIPVSQHTLHADVHASVAVDGKLKIYAEYELPTEPTERDLTRALQFHFDKLGQNLAVITRQGVDTDD